MNSAAATPSSSNIVGFVLHGIDLMVGVVVEALFQRCALIAAVLF
jgi:hypothetical protein